MGSSATKKYRLSLHPDLTDLLKFAAVPEPGSLALIVGALGAGWIVRRRKTNV